jgi:hypothetical protein
MVGITRSKVIFRFFLWLASVIWCFCNVEYIRTKHYVPSSDQRIMSCGSCGTVPPTKRQPKKIRVIRIDYSSYRVLSRWCWAGSGRSFHSAALSLSTACDLAMILYMLELWPPPHQKWWSLMLGKSTIFKSWRFP